MARPISLEKLAGQAGYPNEVRDMVLDHVEKAGTRERIESGELVLPHPIDAQIVYDREQAAVGRQRIHAADADTVKALQDRLSKLESQLANHNPAELPIPPDAEG